MVEAIRIRESCSSCLIAWVGAARSIYKDKKKKKTVVPLLWQRVTKTACYKHVIILVYTSVISPIPTYVDHADLISISQTSIDISEHYRQDVHRKYLNTEISFTPIISCPLSNSLKDWLIYLLTRQQFILSDNRHYSAIRNLEKVRNSIGYLNYLVNNLIEFQEICMSG